MNNDSAQAALATLSRYVQNECRDETITRLRKQRHAATQRAYATKRTLESFKLQVEFLKDLNKLLLNQITKLRRDATVVSDAFSR